MGDEQGSSAQSGDNSGVNEFLQVVPLFGLRIVYAQSTVAWQFATGFGALTT